MTNFFSSGLRQKVDQLMDILYSGGVNNPMDSIEQCSYLLFLRLLTEKDEVLATLDKKYTRIFSGKWSQYAWGNFVTLTGDNLFNAVRDAIEKLHELPGLSDAALGDDARRQDGAVAVMPGVVPELDDGGAVFGTERADEGSVRHGFQ